MAVRPVQVNIKAVDAAAVGEFWAEALGWTAYNPGVTTYVGPASGLVWPDPVFLGVDVVPVPEPKTAVKNRMHLDLATTSAAHQEEVIARLRIVGATPVDIGQGEVPWTVLADPEGNEFCVLEPREIYRATGPIAAVVARLRRPAGHGRVLGRGDRLDPARGDRPPRGAALPQGTGPYLELLRVPDARRVPDRLHLDLLPYPGDDQAGRRPRLREHGAADLDLGQGDVPWTCLTDPEGHEFCVLAPL